MDDIIVIVGPTGVGKTKLSIELAKVLNAEIINGDSVSIYKKLDIGSAKPTKEEQNTIIHHLIDIKDVDEDYSVYDYQIDCRKAIEEIKKNNKRIIIVGGTGLYIKAALYNYQFSKETKKNNYDDLETKDIIKKIESISDNMIQDKSNRRRLIRLLNKLDNKEIITYNKDECLYPIKVIGLTVPRNILYSRINKRVDSMIKNGLLDEINTLKKDYKKSRVLNSAIGYKEFKYYFDNKITLEETIEEIKKNSRRFAKRQYTFFNHQFPTKWFEVDLNNFNNTVEEVYNYIEKGTK